MANNTKFVIIYDHKNPKDELSFDDLKNVLQFLEESDVTTEAFQNMEKKTVFGGVANRLSALTDKAEEYRVMLENFIAEADALIDEMNGVDDEQDDEE
ncbi:MAG: hypothetical protein AB7D36_12105 [Oscillospiraceae bacterium]|jgi:hypothetical protein